MTVKTVSLCGTAGLKFALNCIESCSNMTPTLKNRTFCNIQYNLLMPGTEKLFSLPYPSFYAQSARFCKRLPLTPVEERIRIEFSCVGVGCAKGKHVQTLVRI